jgi:endonuclease YncB( thermonuclease family)
MYLRGRTVTCDLAGEEWQGAVIASCRYVKTDLSQWLVQNGWAEAEAGSPLSQAEEQARADRRGIFGDDPRKDGPSTLGPAPRREDPLNPI